MKCPEAVCENHDGERGDCGLHIYLYKLIKNVIMENSTKRFLKKWHALAAIFFLAAFATNVQAQNVTISPQNGSMICALTSGSPNTQLGFQIGAFGTWRHNQLSLTMTGSNYSTLTEDGQLDSHSNHFITGDKCTFSPDDPKRTPSKYIVADWGGDGLNTGYITIALPKGYRFTGYTFHLSHDVSMFGENNTAFTLTTNTNVYMTETNEDFTGNRNRVTLGAESATVHEFTRTGDDMGNILYFTTSASRSGFYAMTFRYIELTFTADADAPVDIKPSSQVSTGTSMLEVPFNTGKVDLGQITQGTYQGATRVSYQYNRVSDMSANMLLYEAESIKDGTGFDGTSGKVTDKKNGSITTSGNYFRFAPDEKDRNNDGKVDDDDMQIYYLETPVSAKMTETLENPVQFRITGATIHYAKDVSQAKSFHITCEIDGTTYYLNTNGIFVTNAQVVWTMDDAGHIFSGNDYIQATNGSVNIVHSAANATVYSLYNNTIRYGQNRYLKARPNYEWDWSSFSYRISYYDGYVTNSTSYTTATIEEVSGGESEGAIIYVYDKEGKNPYEITVSGTGSYPIPDLNNDAIMFGVKGGDEAFLNFTLEVQALNPYINQMSVVMNDTDDGKNLRMTQTFTSDDFSVGGDKFIFYLPTDCKGDKISMTFEDLYSKYGDETYDHTGVIGDNHSRYNFVKSQHNIAFTDDNIYKAKEEAASSTRESVRLAASNGAGSMVRTKVGTVGDTPFRFNNADVLATTSGYLTEYPFTLYNYAHQTNGASGSFIAAEFENVGDNGTATDNETFYVFTTDETRYNIAPTTATQHRAYAFYAMEVELICYGYNPSVEFVPIYDNSFNETGNKEFFGVKVSAPAAVTTPLASDLAVHKAIVEKIMENKPADVTGTEAIDAYVEAEMKKILYLDMSKLKGVYHSNAMGDEDKPYELSDFNVLKAKFAPNALVFLPINTTSTFDNFAYAMKGEVAGAFKSANNIILTDKNPFFSPYTIQVDAANYAIYTRKLTKSTYGSETYATVMMPFTIKFDEGTPGIKTDDKYGKFTFLQMNTTSATSDNAYNYGPSVFFSKTTGTQVEANTPYALRVENKGESEDCFTLRQYGSNIVATPDDAKSENTLFSATEMTSTGNLTDKAGKTNSYSFSHKGSFSGYKIPKSSPKTFYFANNGFYSSVELNSNYSTVDLYPFRSVYEVTGGGSAKVGFLRLIEGENETDGIDVFKATSAEVDMNAPVYDLQGRMIAPSYREAKKLQSGMYVVNGVKIIVK